jgi:hypothetical protein
MPSDVAQMLGQALALHHRGLTAEAETAYQDVLVRDPDGPRFARDVEAAYRKVWREWCSNAKPHP